MVRSKSTEAPFAKKGSSSYARNVVYNLLGQLVPLAVGLITIPVLLRALGVERLGVLGIAWMIVGYSGFLDLGLSRSITQITAEYLGRRQDQYVADILWTALTMSGLLAVIAGVLTLGMAGLVVDLMKISPGLREEVLCALRVFSLSVPATIVTSILIGFLTGFGRFGVINAIKVPTGLLLTAGPLLSVAFGSASLVPVMAILAGARWVSLGAFAWAAVRVAPSALGKPRFRKALLRRLLGLGSWITITNVISPVLVYCDRFLIGSMLTVTAVAYYTTPQDAVNKLLVLPVAVVSVLFPYIAERHVNDRDHCLVRSREILEQTFVLIFPIVMIVVFFARDGMTLWLGGDFAGRTCRLLQIFALGVLINGVAQVPATILQGIGKPRWPATLHMVELVVYIPIAYVAISYLGLEGAALAWAGRIFADAAALTWAVGRVWGKPILQRSDLLLMGSLTGGLVSYIAFGNERHRILFALLTLAVFFAFYRTCILGLLKGAVTRLLPQHSTLDVAS